MRALYVVVAAVLALGATCQEPPRVGQMDALVDGLSHLHVWDKDMQVIGDYARRIRVPTPIFNATKGIYIKAMKSGFGGRDTAAVCAVLEKMAKVRRRKR